MGRQPDKVTYQLPGEVAVMLRWMERDGQTIPDWLRGVVCDHMHKSGIATEHSLEFSSIRVIDEDEGIVHVEVSFVPAKAYVEAIDTEKRRALQFLAHSVRHFCRNKAAKSNYYDLSAAEQMVYLMHSGSNARWVIDGGSVQQVAGAHGVARLVHVRPGQSTAPHLRRTG